jgi:hypothetical protein
VQDAAVGAATEFAEHADLKGLTSEGVVGQHGWEEPSGRNERVHDVVMRHRAAWLHSGFREKRRPSNIGAWHVPCSARHRAARAVHKTMQA